MKNSSARWIKYWNTLIRHGLSEVRLVSSPKDFGILYNKFLFLLHRTSGSHAAIGSIPPGIQIEPTNYCNALCICCSTYTSTRKRGFMDITLFRKIIDDARQNNIKIVHLYLHGEPLLHPKIIEMIGYIKQQGLAVHLTTNGMLLTRDMALGILNSGVDLADHFTFSILGSSKEIHEKVMERVKHEQVLENIDTFLKLRKEMRASGPIIETIFYPMPENRHEATAYLGMFKGYVDHARMAPRISQSFANHNAGRAIPSAARRKPCSHLQERLTVFWNGDVTLCHHDINGEWVFGNLEHRSLWEICQSGELLNVQMLHSQRQFEQIRLCHDCDA